MQLWMWMGEHFLICGTESGKSGVSTVLFISITLVSLFFLLHVSFFNQRQNNIVSTTMSKEEIKNELTKYEPTPEERTVIRGAVFNVISLGTS